MSAKRQGLTGGLNMLTDYANIRVRVRVVLVLSLYLSNRGRSFRLGWFMRGVFLTLTVLQGCIFVDCGFWSIEVAGCRVLGCTRRVLHRWAVFSSWRGRGC